MRGATVKVGISRDDNGTYWWSTDPVNFHEDDTFTDLDEKALSEWRDTFRAFEELQTKIAELVARGGLRIDQYEDRQK